MICFRCNDIKRIEDDIDSIKDMIEDNLDMCEDISGQYEDVIMLKEREIVSILAEDCLCQDMGRVADNDN